MNRGKIERLILNLKKLYNLDTINRIAKKHLFIRRKGKVSAKSFLNLCTFLGEDLCSDALSLLCSKLEANEKISISPQALSKRFNKDAVNFMKGIFHEMLKFQNEVLRDNGALLKNNFNRITVVDSTTFKLADKHEGDYKGTGTKSAVKIQLQYDLLTGEFIHCELKQGSYSDASYLETLQSTIEKHDLILKDLGYLKALDLKIIDEKEAFYISRAKVVTILCKKEEVTGYGKKGNLVKRDWYLPINIKELLEPLAEGETIELDDIYIGNTAKNRTKFRLILTKLTKECKLKKEIRNKSSNDRSGNKLTDENKWWLELNCFMTNIPKEVLSKEKVYEIYALRWQVEIMFKIWKSLFKIDKVKKAGLERIQCFIYGRLIMLLITSSIVFTARKITYSTTGKELSEIKSFGIVQQYFDEIHRNIFKATLTLYEIFRRTIMSIQRYGIKSKRKDKKTAIKILRNIKITEDDLLKMVA